MPVIKLTRYHNITPSSQWQGGPVNHWWVQGVRHSQTFFRNMPSILKFQPADREGRGCHFRPGTRRLVARAFPTREFGSDGTHSFQQLERAMIVEDCRRRRDCRGILDVKSVVAISLYI
jgi:hypothetical protein